MNLWHHNQVWNKEVKLERIQFFLHVSLYFYYYYYCNLAGILLSPKIQKSSTNFPNQEKMWSFLLALVMFIDTSSAILGHLLIPLLLPSLTKKSIKKKRKKEKKERVFSKLPVCFKYFEDTIKCIGRAWRNLVISVFPRLLFSLAIFSCPSKPACLFRVEFYTF